MQLSEQSQTTISSNTGDRGSCELPSLVVVDHTKHKTTGSCSCHKTTSLSMASSTVKDCQHHLQRSPCSKKEAMKSINEAASSYLSSNGTQATSTSKIVDQALHVVKSLEAANNSSNLDNQSKSASSSGLSHATDPSSKPSHHRDETNIMTTASSAAVTVASSTDSTTSSSSCSNGEGTSGGDTPPSEPNFIAPALRKIAKKRRKEPDKNGMERSSFHHTKSSKEYLRKAQEALRRQQELQEESSSPKNGDVDNPEPLPPPFQNKFHSPRSNFRRLSALASSTTSRFNVDAPPFSRSQSCSNVDSDRRNDQDVTPCTKNSDFYGYEDPDSAPSNFIPAARRMGPARRRGSVTKYSLQAAQAAQKATERVMELQGLNWNGTLSNNNCVSVSCNDPRSETPAARRRLLYGTMGETTAPPTADKQTMPVEKPVRRESISAEDYDATIDNMSSSVEAESPITGTDAMEISNPYGYEEVPTTRTASGADPDVLVSRTSDFTSSNPYGYEATGDFMPCPAERRHPRARRRGSVTKFSLDASKSVIASEIESVIRPSQNDSISKPPDNPDYIQALKPPAAGRPLGAVARNRRFGNSTEGPGPVDDDQKANSPRRTGPRRSSSARHLPRFGTPSRSSSFLSKGNNSVTSFEDDADSLAPDMESLCSIHDRIDNGLDSAPVPPAPTAMSPITPGVTPGSMRKKLGVPIKSWSEGNSSFTPSLLLDSDFAILPFAVSCSDSKGSSRMPAPIRRTPSSSSASNRSRIPISIQAALPVGAHDEPTTDLCKSTSFTG